MYRVKIELDTDDKVLSETINSVQVSKNPRRITGTGTNGIRGINVFTFIITKENPGYELLFEKRTRVTVFNTISNRYDFSGRVLIVTDYMTDSGEYGKKVYCECKKGYLKDSSQLNTHITAENTKSLLSAIIKTHNEQVPEAYKHFEVGNVDVEGVPGYTQLGYDKSYNTIETLLINNYGGYIIIRSEGNINYIDYLKSPGEVMKDGIVLAKNLISLEREKDPSEVVTRFIPLGNKVSDEIIKLPDGTEIQNENRLTIKDVNDGKNYLVDIDSEYLYTTNYATEVFDTDDPEELKGFGEEYFKSLTRARKSYAASALDLSFIGITKDELIEGNSYPLVNELLNINETIMISERTYQIEAPEAPYFIFGDKFLDSKTSAKETASKLKNVQDNIAKTNRVISEDKTQYQKNLDNKVDKVFGKGLSTNDYTAEDKNKLDSLTALVHIDPVGKSDGSADGIKNYMLDLIAGDYYISPAKACYLSFLNKISNVVENLYLEGCIRIKHNEDGSVILQILESAVSLIYYEDKGSLYHMHGYTGNTLTFADEKEEDI